MSAEPVSLPKARLSAPKEALAVWAVAFCSLLLATLLIPSQAKLVATVTFLYLPLWVVRKRGEDYPDYGLTLRHWRKDLAVASAVFAVIAPLYFLAYYGWAELMPKLPAELSRLLTPYAGPPRFAFKLPPRFDEWVLDQLFVTALPEEFFYRGYLETRLRDAWPNGKVVFGVRVGRALLLTALLFALGHLALFHFWRLSVFFPALIFSWVRGRTGTIIGCTLLHAAFNLYEMVLRSSFGF